MSQFFFYPPTAGSTLAPGSATAANQVTQIGIETGTETAVQSIDTKTPSQGQKTMANSSPVVIASDQSPVPVSISGGLANPLPVHDAANDVNLSTRASEATLSAFSAKSASAFVNVPFDETVITYVGASSNIDQVVYKLAGVTQQTLTMSYDGSNRLSDVLKS